MTQNPMAWDGGINPRIADFPKAQGCMLPMGVTSENVAEKFGIDRKTQDAFAAASHKKAAAAQQAGKFKEEIIPVHTKVRGEVVVVVLRIISHCSFSFITRMPHPGVCTPLLP
jgi:acetyl-CoA acetyltransferase